MKAKKKKYFDVETLENQLHQQYAENDNNRSGIFTSFIIGIVALFGFYGFVYANTNKINEDNIDIFVLLLLSFVTIGLLFFLAILVLFLGYSLRRDQAVVNNIRRKRYNSKKKLEEIFGNIYSTDIKGYCEFIPDFYNLFYWLFFGSEIFIFITTLLKYIEFDRSSISCCKCIFTIIIFLFHFAFLYFTLKIRCNYHKKYKDKCKEK